MEHGPQPRKSLTGLPPHVNPTKSIILYICPTDGCPNYFASPDFRPDRAEIEEMQFHRSHSDGRQVPSHPRTECPFCRDKGMRVQRVPYIVTEIVALKPMVAAVRAHEEANGVAA